MELLRCENISKVYGTGDGKTVALQDVSFSVEKGEFVSIVGASGSGKSTLLHIIGGVDKPTSGKVFINGTDIHSQSEDKLAIFRRRHIGLVYQFYNLLPELNVDENIVLPHMLDGRKPDKERLDQIVEYLGLSDRRSHLPSELSGGQQQRASIGRALFSKPELLLIVELLKESNRKFGQTLILITHDENIALQADRIIYMEDGNITKDDRIRVTDLMGRE